MPFFSVITCTYNSEKYLAEVITSVEEQGCGDYEHIFIDAFSDDGTKEMLDAYRLRNPGRVFVFQREPQGISDAMNYGIEQANGDVLVHLHGDDLMADNALLTVKNYFDTSGVTVVIGNCKLLKLDNDVFTWPLSIFKRGMIKFLFMPLMFFTNLVAHPATYIKKSVFQRHGCFDLKYKVVMDYDFWFRIFKSEPKLLANEVLAVYRFHSETASSRQHVLSLKEIDEVRNYYKWDYPFSYLLFQFFLSPILVVRRILKSI